jgi:hypothetical protein
MVTTLSLQFVKKINLQYKHEHEGRLRNVLLNTAKAVFLRSNYFMLCQHDIFFIVRDESPQKAEGHRPSLVKP